MFDATLFTSSWLISEPFLGVESLLISSKSKLITAIAANEGFIL